jgi:hypothetical protein
MADNLADLEKQIEKTKLHMAAKLDEVRGQIKECDDESHWLQNSPFPLSDALENIDRFVASRDTFSGMAVFFSDLPSSSYSNPLAVKGQTDNNSPLHVVNGMVAGSHPVNVDLSSVLCALFPDTVKAALVEQAKRHAEQIDAGPPKAERPELIQAAKQRRHALEVGEEALISQAEAAGLEGFYRRYEFNPAIGFMKEASHA